MDSARESTAPAAATAPLGTTVRVAMLGLAVMLAGMLGVARGLAPDQRGLGTHQQLGLPPCSVRVLWGTRCPACGMTTSWALMTRGRVADAWRTNAGGVVLAVLAACVAPGAAWCAARGRAPSVFTLWIVAIGLAGAIAIAGLDWLVRVF